MLDIQEESVNILICEVQKAKSMKRVWNDSDREPEIQGVRTPSPMTKEVASMVKINRKNLAILLFSRPLLKFEHHPKCLLGNSSL